MSEKSDRCPKCGAPATLYRGDFGVIYECETSITHGKIEEGEDCLRCQLDHAQARYDALRITSETTIGQLRQQAKHLEDRAKELEESQDDAESIISCVAMMARFYPRDTPIRTPVLQHVNATLTAGVLFLAEDWFVARLDAEERAEWEKIAADLKIDLEMVTAQATELRRMVEEQQRTISAISKIPSDNDQQPDKTIKRQEDNMKRIEIGPVE